mmetsp:Transcript_2678/g.3047  ORF Transcript_2678/g.3047 Transcript_2678/m.3047 type:complete len:453 (+) Transcript_2678:88-1446(+)|eukprot:CAMPEP_0197859472 /NCGR_PEP_ID=MMETSP1438-20131217/34049_1 /TAXON_ID=1461541 /ORGANISM="Pterosperma sp., Strain CCMP1384" /LENGTH=452 /DNA_ID=CAMNT_0043475967 /DNA_START=88 /DNA_END=1446 /DNA_ORIENTATION=+
MAELEEGYDANGLPVRKPLLEDELEEQVETIVAQNGTPLTAFFTIVNGLVGGGLLALPAGFKYAGISAATISMIIIGAASTYTLIGLVKVKNMFPKGSVMRYEEAGRKLFGERGRSFTSCTIIASQMGFASAYIVFITDNFFKLLTGDTKPPHGYAIPYPVGIMLVWAVASILGWIRDMSVRGLLSGAAVVILAFSMIMLFYCGFRDGEPLHSPFDPIYGPQLNLSTYPSFFGIAAFAFCCHGIVFAVEESIADPPNVHGDALKAARLTRWSWSVTAAVVTSGSIYIVVGALGFMFFPTTVSPAITNDLKSDWAGLSVTVGLSLMCLTCAPLQLVPVIVAAEDALHSRGMLMDDKGLGYWQRNGVRAAVTAVPSLIALGLPCFGQVTALVGGLFTSTMGFILPPVFYMKATRESLTTKDKVICYSVISIGVVGMIAVVTLTIIQFAKGECSN